MPFLKYRDNRRVKHEATSQGTRGADCVPCRNPQSGNVLQRADLQEASFSGYKAIVFYKWTFPEAIRLENRIYSLHASDMLAYFA